MLNERFIQHASGDSSRKFVNGFYLYYIMISDAEGSVVWVFVVRTNKVVLSLSFILGLTMEPLVPLPSLDTGVFHNEWMEVDVPDEIELNNDIIKNGWTTAEAMDQLVGKHYFKDVYVDVDVSKKSDRQEWGHVRYQSMFKPEEAFEITVQWIQATGSIITDLVQSWSRKAQQCNLQLVPVYVILIWR